MTARVVLSVELSDDDGDRLLFEFDAEAGTSQAIDVRHASSDDDDRGSRLFSCSLADLRSFGDAIATFVEHYEDEEPGT